MKAVLRLDGSGSALLMHNERLQDPLDPHTRAVAEISGKRRRTDADHLELGHREFLGSLYTNGNGPCLPAFNVIRCLQEGAKRSKRGKDVLRGVFPLVEHVDVLYEGPRDPEQLWLERESFSLRKGVVVSGRRVTRTRPHFRDFAIELPVEIDPIVFDLDSVETCWADAGKYVGIGDNRPIYGRFVGTVLSEDEWLKQADGDTESIWTANKTSIERVLTEDDSRRKRHVLAKSK